MKTIIKKFYAWLAMCAMNGLCKQYDSCKACPYTTSGNVDKCAICDIRAKLCIWSMKEWK